MPTARLTCPSSGEEWFKRTDRAGYTFMIRQLAETRVYMFTSRPEHILMQNRSLRQSLNISRLSLLPNLATITKVRVYGKHLNTRSIHAGPVIIHSLSSLLGRGVFSSDGMITPFNSETAV